MKESDVVCLFGEKVDRDLLHWLDEQPERILICAGGDASSVHPRHCIFSLGLFWEMQLEAFVQKFLFMRIEFLCREKDKKEQAEHFFERFRMRLAEAELRFSDAREFGIPILQNALRNGAMLPRSAFGPALKGCCEGMPAIVCGGGPSLESLKDCSHRALLIGCGSGGMVLHAMGITPHALAYLDPDPPLARFSAMQLGHVPLFYQSRFAHSLLAGAPNPLVWMPESGNWPFERYLREECGVHAESFDTGWTAGTFGAALAVHLGCNPIFLAGMDFCVVGTTYACALPDEEHAGAFIVYEGKKSRSDWVMSVHWLARLIENTPNVHWLHVTKDGLFIPGAKRIEKVDLPQVPGNASLSIPKVACHMPSQERCAHVEKQFEESLMRAKNIAQEWLEMCKDPEKQGHCTCLLMELEEECCYAAYLQPLWRLWCPLLLRSPGKEEMHKMAFFIHVLEEWHGRSR